MSVREARSRSVGTILTFRAVDPEARIGLPVGRHTAPSIPSSLLLGTALTLIAIVVAYWIKGDLTVEDSSVRMRREFWGLFVGHFGVTTVEVFLFFWSAAFLFLKALKIRAQRHALKLQLLPADPGFVLNAATSVRVLQAIETGVDGAAQFLYLKRIMISLRSMRNVGRVADVDDMLQAAAANDQSILESGYTMLKGFTWAIPVLGFIGTVIGLTMAMGSFSETLREAASKPEASVAGVTRGLTEVMGGLDTAFICTGEALILVFIVHMGHIFVRNADESLLDDAREEAHAQIGARVRLEHRSQA